MPWSFLVLIGFQLAGEILQRIFRLPLPGPVIGMFLLTATLVYRQRTIGHAAIAPSATAEQTPLTRTANSLIANMGLLFVPAGVGIMTQIGVLRREWLPLVAGLIGSTLLSLLVTGLVLHHFGRVREESLRASIAKGRHGIAKEHVT
jgi:holin-like protein